MSEIEDQDGSRDGEFVIRVRQSGTPVGGHFIQWLGSESVMQEEGEPFVSSVDEARRFHERERALNSVIYLRYEADLNCILEEIDTGSSLVT